MAHEMSITLTGEEYAALSTEAAESGKPIEALAHEILAQRLPLIPPSPQPMTSRAFTEQQYREGKVLTLPTREPLTADEAAARERLAQRLRGGTLASDTVIEDRGPR